MIKRFFQSIPLEVWSLLLILTPLLWRCISRIMLIDVDWHMLRGPADPDPWLRLTLVRDWLMGGGWFDHSVARTNAPYGGITTPWTRPLDLVIAALVKIQPESFSLDARLLRAAAALPVLWVLLLMLGIFRAVRQFPAMPSHTPLLATALTATIPLMWNYFGQGNADHHAPLTALWAWVISYSIQQNPRARDMWVQGALLALMLWISPEALVLIGLVYALHGARWIYTGERIFLLIHLTSATAYGSILALLAERAPGTWLTPIYDSISIVHVLLLVLCAVLVRMFAFATTLRGRAGLAISGACVLIAIMAATYPLFFKGPMAEVDRYIFTHFLPRIVEAKSIFGKSILYIAAILFLPIMAKCSYSWLLRTRDPVVPRDQALVLLALLLATTALCATQQRWNYYLFPVLAIMLAPIIGSLFTPDHRWPSRLLLGVSETRQAIWRVGLIVLLLATPTLLLKNQPRTATPASRAIDRCEASARALIYSGRLTKTLGNEPLIIYAPTNLGAEILFFTPYRIIASNYHREGKGIRYLWEGLRIDNWDDLHTYLNQRKVNVILTCPDAAAPKTSILLQHKTQEKPPAWLRKIPLKENNNKLYLFRIDELKHSNK